MAEVRGNLVHVIPTLFLWASFFLFIECAVIPQYHVPHFVHQLTELKEAIGQMENVMNSGQDYIYDYEALISGDRHNVPDAALTASSSNSVLQTKCSRLGIPDISGCPTPAWAPKTTTGKDWIQADLGQMFDIHAVATQGRGGSAQWLTSYRVASLQGSRFIYCQDKQNGEIKDFLGNYDSDTPIRHIFEPSIRARVVRLYPLTYKSHPSLRWELYGK